MKTDDKMMYNACPDCHKKVQEEAAGYRCEHCAKTHMTMTPTYMLSAYIADLSGGLFVQFPRELGDAIMGMSAKEFSELRERANGDETVIRAYLQENVYNKVSSIFINLWVVTSDSPQGHRGHLLARR